MDTPIISHSRYRSILFSQSPDTKLVSPGPRHLSHRAQRRSEAFRAVTLRQSQRRRPPSSLARFSSHQLRRYPVSGPSYCSSGSSSEWLRVWQGSLSSEHTPYLSPNKESRLQPTMLTREIPRRTSPPNQPTTASLRPPATSAFFSSAKLNSANRC